MNKPTWRGQEISNDNPNIIIENPPSYIEVVENRIYFYSDIDSDRVLQLNKRLRELSDTLLVTQKKLSLEEPISIYLHINSYGGFVFDGFAAMDEIIKNSVPVVSVVDGACASAATFLSVAANKRLIKAHAFMLIHQLSSGWWGKYTELKDEMQNLDLLMNTIRKVYKKYTKVPKTKLDEILKHDVWFSADECIKLGLADEII